MSRVALFLLVLSHAGLSVAHPGHDAPEPHFHAIWEVVFLVAVVAVLVVIRIRRSSLRRDRRHARIRS